jgi:hypothetical protein
VTEESRDELFREFLAEKKQGGSPPTVTCARIREPRIPHPLKRKGLAEPNRKNRELRVLRVHESDYPLIGKPHESWLNLEWGNRSSGCSPGER